jgi:hypothetical protein
MFGGVGHSATPPFFVLPKHGRTRLRFSNRDMKFLSVLNLEAPARVKHPCFLQQGIAKLIIITVHIHIPDSFLTRRHRIRQNIALDLGKYPQQSVLFLIGKIKEIVVLCFWGALLFLAFFFSCYAFGSRVVFYIRGRKVYYG